MNTSLGYYGDLTRNKQVSFFSLFVNLRAYWLIIYFMVFMSGDFAHARGWLQADDRAISISISPVKKGVNSVFALPQEEDGLSYGVFDVTAPVLLSSTPKDGNTNMTLSQNLTLTFDTDMVIGTGNITIVETGVGDFEQLDVTNGSLVSISTTTVTLNPNGVLKKGTAYHVLIDATALDDSAGNSFTGISDATTLNFTTVNVVINEVVTDPQQDWSGNDFNGTAGSGTVSSGVDEFVELFISSSGIDFTDWTIELIDGSDIFGDLTSRGAFDATSYTGSGTFNNTAVGDYLVLGNVDGAGAMNNTVRINLKDPGGAIVDAVNIGRAAGQAPTGDASSLANESVQRFTNGLDTDVDSNDFTKGFATMGAANSGPSITLTQETAVLTEAESTNTITATLSAISSQSTTVDLDLKAGSTATLTNDFTLASSSIVIPAGNMTGTATLTTVQDAIDEDNETVTIEITGVINGLENGIQEVASSVTDDDPEPTVTLSQSTTTFSEDAGNNTITATLSAVSGKDVTVIVDVKSGGTATIINDFTLSSNSIVIAAGNTSGTTTLTAVQDVDEEDDETVILEIASVTNGLESDNQEVISSITDDDGESEPLVTLSIGSSTIVESEGTSSITATLSEVSSKDVTVTLAYSGTAVNGTDYNNTASTTIVITAGNTTANTAIEIAALQDEIPEINETIIVDITVVTNGAENGIQQQTITIIDDDTPNVSFADIAASGDESANTATLPVNLSLASELTITLDYTVSGTATGSGTDYTLANGVLIFNPSNTTQDIIITGVIDDTILEGDETVIVTLSNPVNANLGTNTMHTYTITDNDAAAVTIADLSGAEDGGDITVTAILDNSVQGGFTVELSTVDGSALSASDYTAVSGQTLTFAGTAGETQTLTVTPTNDAIEESVESFTVSQGMLAATSLAVNITDVATITLTDDDDNTAPTGFSISIDDAIIGGSELVTSKFNFAGAEIGTTYNYTISSNNGGMNVTGTGTIITATDQVTLADLSGLNNGILTLSVTLTDGSTNVSSAQTANIVLDTTVPAAPVVSSISNDSGVNTEDEITNDQTLSFNGTTEANATVEVFIDGISLGTTTADGTGAFSYDHSATMLTDGKLAVTATATDTAGNVGPTSSALSVIIDTIAPLPPAITTITSDNGINETDGLTNDNTLIFNGTAEANSTIEVSFDGTSIGTVTTDGSGNFSFDHTGTTLADGTYSLTAKSTDISGNTGVASAAISITVDTAPPTISINVFATDDVVDPTERNVDQVVSGTSSGAEDGQAVTIRLNGKTYTTTIASNAWTVTVLGADVSSISPVETITADVNDKAGNVAEQATRVITRLDASIVTDVAVPTDSTYAIGDNLDFVVSFNLPITITGITSIPVTIGSTAYDATQVGTVTNSTAVTFRYTVVEDNFDTDGIALGALISLNGGAIKDQFEVDAILALNNVASTASVIVDGVKPIPTLTTTGANLTNGAFTTTFEYTETVTGFTLEDISVTNGSASNLIEVTTGTKWTAVITPTADGLVGVSLAAGVANDNAGNSAATGATVAKTFDGTAPTVVSITRKDGDQLNSVITSVDFRVIFSEDVLGVDLSDFELSLSGTAGVLNTIQQVDANTYDVNVTGILGQGTIGLNLKDDDSIIDTATNKLGGSGPEIGDFEGHFYTTNFLPTGITLAPASISENNGIGDVVGALSSTDSDTGDTHSYALVTGTGDTDNGSFTIDGTQLKAAQVFDFETTDSYSIRVKTDDGNGGSFERAIEILIDNALEASMIVVGDASFDVSALGMSQQRTLTITNDGETAIEVTLESIPEGFSALPTTLTLTAGTDEDIIVTFIPTEVRAYVGEIVFSYGEGSQSYTLSGEGTIITSTEINASNSGKVSIFPNPTSSLLHFDLSEFGGDKIDIQITNATGIPFLTKDGYTGKKLSIDVSRYKMGIYIVQFTNGQFVVRKKVMIKR